MLRSFDFESVLDWLLLVGLLLEESFDLHKLRNWRQLLMVSRQSAIIWFFQRKNFSVWNDLKTLLWVQFFPLKRCVKNSIKISLQLLSFLSFIRLVFVWSSYQLVDITLFVRHNFLTIRIVLISTNWKLLRDSLRHSLWNLIFDILFIDFYFLFQNKGNAEGIRW